MHNYIEKWYSSMGRKPGNLKGAGQNLAKIALELGLNRNAIYVMRKTSPQRFDYIFELDPKDFKKAYRAYQKEMDDTKARLVDIYYELFDKQEISKFGRLLKDRGVFNHKNSFGTTIIDKIFSSRPGFWSHSSYVNAVKTVEIYDEYLEIEEKEKLKESA